MEKRIRVAAELKADPARSDREIAKAVGVHNETVGLSARG
jgi:DNA-binding Lrp family transcriptional regulator